MRRRTHDPTQGQALVEFAVILPVLMLLVLGLFDAGRAVLFYTELANASRAGARVAIVNQSNDATCGGPERTFKCAAADLTMAMDVDPLDIVDLAISGSPCSLPSDCTATVRVDYRFEPITPLIGAIVGVIDLSASTTMPLERVYPISTP